MPSRKHRPRFGKDIVCCGKCNENLYTGFNSGIRFGKCLACGWENRSVTKRGIAPSEGSRCDSKTKAHNHKLKREKKSSSVGADAVHRIDEID